MGEVVAAVTGDVDRNISDQADATLGGICAQGLPLPLESHLVGEGSIACEGRPVVDPERVRRAESLDLGHRDRRVGIAEET